MFAHVTNLRYWKSERADITTCEDASRADPQRGLFCVSDGAGTTLFSNIWAEILVEHFTRAPLASLDAFEMDWWIRQAQKDYRARAPQADKLNWNARQKAAEQGAYATLATLRFLSSDAQAARAELLAIGDSCVIIGQPAQRKITAFPLQHATDFDRAPYCVPALLKNLNRKTLYARTLEVTLAPGEIVILATDAVARWIINGGATGDENSAWDAFQAIASIETEHHWQELIDSCRANQSMVDDDATAVIVRLLAPEQSAAGSELGSAAEPPPALIAERKAEFEQALAENNKELLAVLYGDGQMLQRTDLTLPTPDEIARAREVADAMREVLQAMREAIKAPNFAAKMEPTWRQYAAVLIDEPCAESIRKTLASQGLNLRQAPTPQIQALPQNQPPAAQLQFAPQAQSVPQPRFGTPPDAPLFPAQAPAQAVPQAWFGPQSTAPGSDNPALPQLTGHEPEQARVIMPAPLTPELARLRQVLDEGTPQEKITAWQALTPEQIQFQLSSSDQLQLDLAQQLLDALKNGNTARVCAAYDEIEKPALRKHFTFTPDEQQHIREALSTRASIEQLRAVLRNDGKSVSLLVRVYQTIHAPQSFLTHEEQHILEAAQTFTHFTIDSQQTMRVDNPSHVYAYDQLFFSRYHFTFDAQERSLVERLRSLANVGYPPLAQVNQTRIDSAQFFAFAIVLPHYARLQIRQNLELRSKERSESSIYQLNQYIEYWKQYLTDPYNLVQFILDELIEQALIEQAMGEEEEKSRRALEKEAKKWLDEFFKEIKAPLEKDERRSLLPLSEQHWRHALMPFAQRTTMGNHLLTTVPGQTIDAWLRERKHGATIHYYPDLNAQTPTTDQQECWIYRWWFLRQPSIRSQQGEIEHA